MMDAGNKEVTVAEAKAEALREQQACSRAIVSALKRYGCALDVEMVKQGPVFMPQVTVRVVSE